MFGMMQLVFIIDSMTQYVENFNLQIPYDHICLHSLKIQSRSLKLYFRTDRSSPNSFPFLRLVLSKSKQICIKNCKDSKEKELAIEMLI